MGLSVKDSILKIVAEQAIIEVGDITLDATPQNLGLDSLGMVEAVFAIEEMYDITVPFNANAPNEKTFDTSTIATLIAAVEMLVAEK